MIIFRTRLRRVKVSDPEVVAAIETLEKFIERLETEHSRHPYTLYKAYTTDDKIYL